MWEGLTIIRGVELWLEDVGMLENHDWEVLAGGPAASEVQCPVRPREGEHNVTFFQQIKGHWFWAMYKDVYSGRLIVKWVRGRHLHGQSRWLEE